MKMKLFILLAIVLPLMGNAQTETIPVPLDEEGTIRYVEVVQQDGDATDLFKRCVKWINKNYKNSYTVTPTRDMVNKKIVIRHRFQLQSNNEEGITVKGGTVMYDMIIRFKEGRYRAEMVNFVMKGTSKFPCENWLPDGSKPNAESLVQLNKFATEKLASLKEGMLPEKVHVEEEW